MATAPRKIDSAIVGLRWTRELSPGALPGGTPVWESVEVNGYEPSGADVGTKPRKTLGNRKRQKGPVVSLDASLGFPEDFCQKSPQGRMQNLMMANFRQPANQAVTAVSGASYTVASSTGFVANSLIYASGHANPANNGLKHVTAVGAGSVSTAGLVAEASPPAGAKIAVIGHQGVAADFSIVAAGTLFALQSAALDLTTLGILPGQPFYIGGDDAATQFAANNDNGFKRARSVSATQIIIDKSDALMSVDPGTGKTIRIFYGRVLKDEIGTDVVAITDQYERTLGAPDTTLPAQVQRQYFIGCVWNTAEFDWPEEDTVAFTSAFLNFDVENSIAPHTPKPGDRPNAQGEDAYSTTTDYSSLRLAVIDPATATPTDLFVYIKDMQMTVNNNAKIAKSLKVLGGFDVTRGTFEIDIDMNPYFTTLAQQVAIRQSKDVTLHGFMAKNNAGWGFDVPVGSLSGGLLEIEIDESIMNPITLGASDGSRVNAAFSHTLLWTFFDYLPNRACPAMIGA